MAASVSLFAGEPTHVEKIEKGAVLRWLVKAGVLVAGSCHKSDLIFRVHARLPVVHLY